MEKTKFQRWFSMLMAGVMLLSITGCGGKKGKDTHSHNEKEMYVSVDKDGKKTVVGKDGKALTEFAFDKDGNITDKDGKIAIPAEKAKNLPKPPAKLDGKSVYVTTDKDGKKQVVDDSGKPVEGYSVDESGNISDQSGQTVVESTDITAPPAKEDSSSFGGSSSSSSSSSSGGAFSSGGSSSGGSPSGGSSTPAAKPEPPKPTPDPVPAPQPTPDLEPAPEPEPEPVYIDLDALCQYAIDYAVSTYGYEYWPGMRDGYFPAYTCYISTMDEGYAAIRGCIDDQTVALEAMGEPIVDELGNGMPFDIEIYPDPDGFENSYLVQLYY